MDITYKTIKELSELNNYPFFTGKYDVNIFGLRNQTKVVNLFNDIIGIAYQDENLNPCIKFYHGTTKPGLKYLGKNLMNSQGTFILAPGFYKKCWIIGTHQNKYKALIQNGSPFIGYRDSNKNNNLDLEGKLYTNVAGLNLHTTSFLTDTQKVNSWSAGCQVIQDDKDYLEFFEIIEKASELYGNTFSYKLFQL